MGMFSRMTDIVQANINAMLDKAEDPQKVIRLIIQEMEETLVEVRSVAAKQIASQKHLHRQIDKLNKEASQWHEKAALALDKEKEALARAALTERQSCIQKAETLSAQLSDIEENLQKLQEDTGRLNAKLSEAKAKQKALQSRQQSAAVRLKAKSVEHSSKIEHAMSRFDQYEQRIDQLEAQVDAYDIVGTASAEQSLAAQFSELERDDAIENELEALKAKKVA